MDIGSIVALIGGLGGFITAIAVGLKYRADAKSQDRKDEVEADRVALDLVDKQQKRIDQLMCRVIAVEKKSDEQDKELVQLREQLRAKDLRIIELERMVSERDEKITELEEEVAELMSRMDIVEKRRRGKTEPPQNK